MVSFGGRVMSARKPRAGDPPPPKLVDRIVDSGCRRVALLGLHPGAGTRTVLESLVRELHERERPCGVTSFPRLPLEHEPPEPITRLGLPPGTHLACADGAPRDGAISLHRVEPSSFDTPLGPIGFYRVVEGGEIELHGPAQPEALAATLDRLADLAGGPAFVDGSWTRRDFAAPDVTDGVVLTVGSGFSETPRRSAAAARTVAERLAAPPCDAAARRGWQSATERGAGVLLDREGREVGALPPGGVEPLPALRAAGLERVAAIALPHRLRDALLAPLVRSELRCTLVVRDATWIDAAPVYLAAWHKSGGRIRVVRATRLLAMTVNPVNATGPDADPDQLLRLVSDELPGLPVHDVVREAAPTRRAWRFWRRSD